jgi:hypothetical protein
LNQPLSATAFLALQTLRLLAKLKISSANAVQLQQLLQFLMARSASALLMINWLPSLIVMTSQRLQVAILQSSQLLENLPQLQLQRLLTLQSLLAFTSLLLVDLAACTAVPMNPSMNQQTSQRSQTWISPLSAPE